MLILFDLYGTPRNLNKPHSFRISASESFGPLSAATFILIIHNPFKFSRCV